MRNGKFHLEFFPNEDETRKNIKFRFEEFFGFLTVCLIKLQKSHVRVISVIWMQNTQKLALGLMNSSLRKYLWYYTWPMCQPYNHSVKGTRTSNFHVADQKRSGMHVQDMRHYVLYTYRLYWSCPHRGLLTWKFWIRIFTGHVFHLSAFN